MTTAAETVLDTGETATSAQLRECPHCGLFQEIPVLPPRAAARCPRCHHVLRHRRIDPTGRPLALALAGLLLFLVALPMPFLDLSVRGRERETTLVTGPVALEQNGMATLAVVVLATTLIVPVLRLGALAWVLAAVRAGARQPYLARLFRWTEILRPWSMVEVFLLGLFVAYTRLVAIAQVDIGPACYAMGGLILASAAADTALDQDSVWEALGPRDAPATRPRPGPRGTPIGCHNCGLVCDQALTRCPRCGGGLRRRKPHSLSRTWALVVAATFLYIPANILPVLTLINLGRILPATILSGVEELARMGLWPLALLVFVASITVPVLKIASLTLMLVTAQFGTGWRLRERTRLYRIVEFIGRWSMIDVFVVSILTAMVQFGGIASALPGTGAVAFCGVVILTMLAAAAFDPRLMWDAAGTGPGAWNE